MTGVAGRFYRLKENIWFAVVFYLFVTTSAGYIDMGPVELERGIAVMIELFGLPTCRSMAAGAICLPHSTCLYFLNKAKLPPVDILMASLAGSSQVDKLERCIRFLAFLMASPATDIFMLSLERKFGLRVIETGLPPTVDHMTEFASAFRSELINLSPMGVFVAGEAMRIGEFKIHYIRPIRGFLFWMAGNTRNRQVASR
jgi:hypothetical protein